MPQDVKAMPIDAESANAAGSVYENLEGWIPPLASDDEIRAALEKAFDYRGDITVTLKDGTPVQGYIFDRNSDSPTLAGCTIRIFLSSGDKKISVSYADVARLEFSGKDTAAGKSFQTWIKKYQERKAAGEKNISLTPEVLD
jgi:hypothetical protein